MLDMSQSVTPLTIASIERCMPRIEASIQTPIVIIYWTALIFYFLFFLLSFFCSIEQWCVCSRAVDPWWLEQGPISSMLEICRFNHRWIVFIITMLLLEPDCVNMPSRRATAIIVEGKSPAPRSISGVHGLRHLLPCFGWLYILMASINYLCRYLTK